MKSLLAMMVGALFSLGFTMDSKKMAFWVVMVLCVSLLAYVRR